MPLKHLILALVLCLVSQLASAQWRKEYPAGRSTCNYMSRFTKSGVAVSIMDSTEVLVTTNHGNTWTPVTLPLTSARHKLLSAEIGDDNSILLHTYGDSTFTLNALGTSLGAALELIPGGPRGAVYRIAGVLRNYFHFMYDSNNDLYLWQLGTQIQLNPAGTRSNSFGITPDSTYYYTLPNRSNDTVKLCRSSRTTAVRPIARVVGTVPHSSVNTLMSVTGIDSLTFIAIRNDGSVWRTTNAGQSWVQRSQLPSSVNMLANFYITDVGNWFFQAYGNRLIFTDGRQVFCSTNQGQTWTASAFIVSRWANVYQVRVSATKFYCRKNNWLYESTDGITWTGDQPLLSGIFSMSASPTGKIFAASEVDLAVSSDGGSTFTSIPGPPLTGNYRQIVAVTDSVLLVSNHKSHVYITKNAGNTWTPQVTNAFDFTPTIINTGGNKLSFFRPGPGFYEFVVSTNRGTTWITNLTNPGPQDVLFGTNGADYFAFGTVRGISKSTDGINWTSATGLSFANIANLAFKNPLTGVAFDYSGNIYRTSDGGNSWLRNTNTLFDAINTPPLGVERLQSTFIGDSLFVIIQHRYGSRYTFLNSSDNGLTFNVEWDQTLNTSSVPGLLGVGSPVSKVFLYKSIDLYGRGVHVYSRPVTVGTSLATSTSPSSERLSVYPQPSSGQQVRFTKQVSGILNIYNSTGQLITTQTMLETDLIHSQHLPTGILLWKLSANDGSVQSGRLVIR